MDFFSDEVLFVLFLFSLSGIVYVKYSNSGYIKTIFSSLAGFGSYNFLNQNKANSQTLSNILLSLNFYISVSIFSVFVLKNFNFLPEHFNHSLIFGLTFGILFFIFYANSFINYVAAYIFKLKNIASEFYNLNQNIIRFAGVILFVINVLVAYSPIPKTAIYGGIIILFLFYLLRILKFIKINLSKDLNSLYLFLYLCTVEIIPLIYMVKLFMICTTTTN